GPYFLTLSISAHDPNRTSERSAFDDREIIERAPRLLRLDVCRADHLAPLLSFVGNELAEVGRRPWKHCAANVSNPRFHTRVGVDRFYLLVELLDDFYGSVLGRAETIHKKCLVAGYEFSHRRDVRQYRRARRDRHRQRAQRTCPDVLDCRGHGG